MAKLQNLINAIKDLSPEDHQAVMNALGVHQQTEPMTLHDDLTIDDYAKWETQLAHREYVLAVAYLQNGLNQAKAAKVAGMHIASAQHIFKNKPSVNQFIAVHIQRLGMEAPEMIFHLARMVRLRKEDLFVYDTGKPILNWARAMQTGALELVKQIRVDDKGFALIFEDKLKALDILTKCAGLQKSLIYKGDIRDLARQAGMSEDDIRHHEEFIEREASELAEKIRRGEFVEIVVGEA